MTEMTTATELSERVDMEKLRIIRDNIDVVYERMGKKARAYNPKTKKFEETDFKTLQTKINEYYLAKVKGDKVK